MPKASNKRRNISAPPTNRSGGAFASPIHPLSTPRSAIVITVAAVPISLVAAMMLPDHIGWVIAGCYSITLLFIWLCWPELRRLTKSLTKENIATIPHDFWVTLTGAGIVFFLGTYLLISGIPNTSVQGAPSLVQSGNCSAQNSPGAKIECSQGVSQNTAPLAAQQMPNHCRGLTTKTLTVECLPYYSRPVVLSVPAQVSHDITITDAHCDHVDRDCVHIGAGVVGVTVNGVHSHNIGRDTVHFSGPGEK